MIKKIMKEEINMKKSKVFLSIVCALLALTACVFLPGCGGEESSSGGQPTEATEKSPAPVAVIDIKDHGKITVELDPDAAPITVENFKKLAGEGFYNGLTFHRIINGFMMQGGDPLGNGTGGSSQTIKGEFYNNGVQNSLSHTRGAISMARSNDPDSASSQFFIVHQDSTFLDGQYAAFGYVTDGMDIVDEICENTPVTDDNGTVEKENQPIINSVTIEE